MALPDSLRALRSPNFRRYFIGQAVSMIGTWVQSVAMMWLAYRISGSTVYTGLIGFLGSAPHIFVAPLAGVLGDRVNRRSLLIVALSLLALQSVALAVLTGLEAITLNQLAALALFAGLCNAFETPTRQSIFAQLLDRREDLPNAIAMNSMLMNGTRLVGPSIGGLLIAGFGETACFALNAVRTRRCSWRCGACVSFRLPPRARRRTRSPTSSRAGATPWDRCRCAGCSSPWRR